MGERADQHLMEFALVDLSNELARLQQCSELRPREKAQRLIEVSREMCKISGALRVASENGRILSYAPRDNEDVLAAIAAE